MGGIMLLGGTLCLLASCRAIQLTRFGKHFTSTSTNKKTVLMRSLRAISVEKGLDRWIAMESRYWINWFGWIGLDWIGLDGLGWIVCLAIQILPHTFFISTK